jgi:hypothetical protein
MSFLDLNNDTYEYIFIYIFVAVLEEEEEDLFVFNGAAGGFSFNIEPKKYEIRAHTAKQRSRFKGAFTKVPPSAYTYIYIYISISISVYVYVHTYIHT